jgi:hypothetical protein
MPKFQAGASSNEIEEADHAAHHLHGRQHEDPLGGLRDDRSRTLQPGENLIKLFSFVTDDEAQ